MRVMRLPIPEAGPRPGPSRSRQTSLWTPKPERSPAIRPASDEDRVPLAVIFAAVAEERDGIATEPPVDIQAQAASWRLNGTFVAAVDRELIGSIHLEASPHGYAEVSMAISREWRGQGVGSTLLTHAINWSRQHDLHKLSLAVFAHNNAAIALYRKFGFTQEGRRVKHCRRSSRELWDVLIMGLLL
jgi:RimJ/RimL family protein N-acetyltransferase